MTGEESIFVPRMSQSQAVGSHFLPVIICYKTPY